MDCLDCYEKNKGCKSCEEAKKSSFGWMKPELTDKTCETCGGKKFYLNFADVLDGYFCPYCEHEYFE